MDFDADKFIYIAAWVVAVVATLLTLLAIGGAYYYNFTATGTGRLDVAVMRMRTGMVPGFRWSLPVAATLAWIAVLSFS